MRDTNILYACGDACSGLLQNVGGINMGKGKAHLLQEEVVLPLLWGHAVQDLLLQPEQGV